MTDSNASVFANFDRDEQKRSIVSFLRFIGIEVEERAISENTFLPGILIDHGKIAIDEEKLLYPGDLLHEAGHLAVVSPEERRQLYNSVAADEDLKNKHASEEMAAIAWSYAACCHLDIPAEVVFHPGGYRGDSEWLLGIFTRGEYFGVPVLNWMKLCNFGKVNHTNDPPYPHMIRWMREE